MSALLYWFGVIMAILSGIANNYGTVLQKKVVNQYKEDSKFIRTLIKKPLWLIGLLLQMLVGSIFFLIAQIYIGPTLIPGLMAGGLIILAIGSVKIVGEQLKLSEVIGIFIMIVAIALLGFSNMAIDISEQNFLEIGLFTRIMIFTLILCILASLFYIMQIKNIYKGISLAIYSGFHFALSNFWISPLMGVLTHVFEGNAILLEVIIFFIAIFILTGNNLLGMTSIQKAFKTGQASNLIPIQQVPIQIAPPFYYLAVFILPINDISSILFLSSGIILIIISSFLLGRRQAAIEKVE